MTLRNVKANEAETAYPKLEDQLRGSAKRWLITGASGFIGSNLLESLLKLDQEVTGLDNFATGKRENLDQVRASVSAQQWSRLKFCEADIRDPSVCLSSCHGVHYILHHAALASVPGSVADPLATNQSNVDGFLNMLWAAREAKIQRFVYASSSSVYGDDGALPKVESQIGECLSPYALSKRVNELYAQIFARCYDTPCIGLRYFNIFGPRQDPEGAYAAVIPKWIAAMLRDDEVKIHGDGETTRDFCFVRNVVQANLLAATVESPGALNQVYNVSVGERTTLNELFQKLRARLAPRFGHLKNAKPTYTDFRVGDVRHSHADISKARALLGYEPAYNLERGLEEALEWYLSNLGK